MSNATSREENQKTKWELVGDVSVDTGQVVIVDPCYVDTPEREIRNSIRIALPFFEDVMDSLGITSIPEDEKQKKVVLEKIKPFMDEMFSGLIDALVPVYQKHLSIQDLKDGIGMYQTPIGKKIAEKSPQITQETMGVSMEWGMQFSSKIQELMEN